MNTPIALPDLTNGTTPHWPTDFGGAHTAPRLKYSCWRNVLGTAPLESRHATMRDLIDSAVAAHALIDEGGTIALSGPGLDELRVLAMKAKRVAHSCLSYGISYDEPLPNWVALLTSPDVIIAR